ncbi:PD-(D/E)XK nuclease domain-containing protein [Halomonas sp. Y3]|uniref:PD-(D/E)XK nuclease domain-containing protein n=1 Tax=Halomonas sp. Y3 TaxID=2956797 RepID=UPI00263F8593|nr:PD-(D/E)XK nuclease domain-containing protein [Halomonas sp. Y3]
MLDDASHHGKVDMTVDSAGHLYLFEFKVVEQLPEGRALQQVKDKGYADKYRGQSKLIPSTMGTTDGSHAPRAVRRMAVLLAQQGSFHLKASSSRSTVLQSSRFTS